MASFIGIWAIVVGVVGLNGFAAGTVAVVHLWKRQQSRGGKVLIAAISSALLPTSLIVPGMLLSASVGGTAPAYVVLGAIMMFAMSLVASLPGAIVVARKLEKPGDEYRAFE
jgi:hypothetical protein